jgi:hypothetical protein
MLQALQNATKLIAKYLSADKILLLTKPCQQFGRHLVLIFYYLAAVATVRGLFSSCLYCRILVYWGKAKN